MSCPRKTRRTQRALADCPSLKVNQRTKKVAGTTTHYVYGAGGLLYGEYDNSGDLIREYVYLNGAPLAQINAGSPETLTYLHPDHLGTPKFGTNAGGTQVWSWTPDAFGNGAPSGSVTVNLRMPGQYFDAESGLFYNWNRYYNPAIGRYISSDPIGLDGGINTFLYAAANPVMAVDPEGLIASECTIYPKLPQCIVLEGGAPGRGGGGSLGIRGAAQRAAGAAGLATTATVVQSATENCPRTTIYRAVDPIELAYLQASGNYGYSPNLSGKYFALTETGVRNFVNTSQNQGRNLTITSTTVATSIVERGFHFNDPGGAGSSVHFSDIQLSEVYANMTPPQIR